MRDPTRGVSFIAAATIPRSSQKTFEFQGFNFTPGLLHPSTRSDPGHVAVLRTHAVAQPEGFFQPSTSFHARGTKPRTSEDPQSVLSNDESTWDLCGFDSANFRDLPLSPKAPPTRCNVRSE